MVYGLQNDEKAACMAKEIHIRKPLAVGNDSIAKGFLSFYKVAIVEIIAFFVNIPYL